jgi:hypothetical protein
VLLRVALHLYNSAATHLTSAICGSEKQQLLYLPPAIGEIEVLVRKDFH